jgi:fructose-bisphosphate aldolase class II
MKSLGECLQEAQSKKVAIGHFNISNLEMLRGIFEAAKKLNLPVLIGVSEGERNFIGVRQVVAVVKSLREEHDFPIFINADHTYSFEKVKEAIDAGFDSVIFDGVELSFDENLKVTKQCVEYARASGRDVIVEAELGFIGKSSKVLSEIPAGVKISEEHLTKPEEAEKFVKETGVDMLAPAVGNIHGMLSGGVDPALNIRRIGEIRQSAGVPLVLHGGSGNSDRDFLSAIDAGVAIIHVSTELRVAYRRALEHSLGENLDEVAPYKYLKEPVLAIEKLVEEKLKLFNRL